MKTASYVFDLHALLYLQSVECVDGGRLQVFDHMTDLVRARCLYFPTIVVKECARYATGEEVHTWAKAVSGSRNLTNPECEYQTIVLDKCDEIADPLDTEESSQLLVAAMALQLDTPRVDVFVVTEDRLEQPTRMCLADACQEIGLQDITVAKFVELENLSEFLVSSP
jgi:hypothetical protein